MASEMGYREYAAHRKAKGLRGGSLRAVQKAIESGRIVLTAAGKIDPADADLRWAATTDQALQRGPEPAGVARADQAAKEPEVLPVLDGAEMPAPTGLRRRLTDEEWGAPLPPAPPFGQRAAAAAPGAVVIDLGSYQEARAKREWAEAEMAMDELRKRRSELVERGDVVQVFATIGRLFASGRENVASALAPRLVGQTDIGAIEREIKAFLRETDTRIANDVRKTYADLVVDRNVAAAG